MRLMREPRRMTDKTKSVLMNYEQAKLTERDIRHIEHFAGLVTKDNSPSALQDSKNTAQVATSLDKVSKEKINEIERQIIDTILDMNSSGAFGHGGYIQWRNRDGVDLDRKDLSEIMSKRNFLSKIVRANTDRKEDRRSTPVRERTLFYLRVYSYFGEEKSIIPPVSDEGWFALFMKDLTKDPNYRSLSLYVECPKKILSFAKKHRHMLTESITVD